MEKCIHFGLLGIKVGRGRCVGKCIHWPKWQLFIRAGHSGNPVAFNYNVPHRQSLITLVIGTFKFNDHSCGCGKMKAKEAFPVGPYFDSQNSVSPFFSSPIYLQLIMVKEMSITHW